MALYLAFKEIWWLKSRFFHFSLVIALITILELFIAGLAESLAAANKEYPEKQAAGLIVFQEDVRLSPTASRIGQGTVNRLKLVPAVAAAGQQTPGEPREVPQPAVELRMPFLVRPVPVVAPLARD